MWISKYPHEYVANLEELSGDFELRWLAAGLLGTHPPVLDSLKQLVDCPRNDALLLLAQIHIEACPHGVGLPRTRLDMKEETESSATLPNKNESILLCVSFSGYFIL